jgi:Tfp pilus assembly protein PilX
VGTIVVVMVVIVVVALFVISAFSSEDDDWSVRRPSRTDSDDGGLDDLLR